jgi:hypothetical protein
MLDTRILNCLPGRRLIRLYLLILASLFTLARPAHSEVTPSGLQQPTGSPVPVSEAGPETDEDVSRAAGPVSGLPLSMSPVSGTGVRVANDTRGNLTGFFVIGMIINVLLITLFLIWAVGQWRKTKK